MKTRATLLSALLVASGLPLAVFYLWPHSTALEEKVAEVHERHLLFAKSASETLRQYHIHAVETFETISDLLLRGRDVSFAADLLASQNYAHFCVVDAETGAVLTDYRVVDAELPNVLPPALLATLHRLADGATVPLSEVRLDRHGTPHFLIARRLGDRIVFAKLHTDFIRDLGASITFGEKGHAAIVDAAGRAIAHPRADWVSSTHDLSDLAPVRRIMAGEAGVETFVSPAIEAEVIAGFAAVPEVGWGVMVPQPMAELEAHAARIFRSAMTVFAAGLGLSAMIGLLVASRAAHMIAAVASAARRMATGEVGVRVAPMTGVSVREFEVLRQAFNCMAENTEAAHHSLRRMAERDNLTGLLTKKAFLDAAAAQFANRPPLPCALYFVDVDSFKSINDIYGHAVGDRVLQEIATCLQKVAGPHDLVCRQSGDEFLFLKQLNGTMTAERFGEVLREALRRLRNSGGGELIFTGSIGASRLSSNLADLETEVGRADAAMYAAKRQGGDTVQVFNEALKRTHAHREQLLTKLKADVARGELRTVYQPILAQETGKLCGFEALARWNAAEGPAVPPAQFIALAEEGGIICEFGRVVRRNAFRFAADLQAAGCQLPVAVNVSGLELARRDFIALFAAELAAAGIDSTSVIVEITESIFDDRAGLAAASLAELQARGVRLCLDDFGKGFSSHGLLLRYHFDCLKVDMNFVGDIATDPRARAIVASLLELGHRMDLPVTLEGIEDAVGARFASTHRVTRVQGYYYSQPLEPQDAIAYARRCKMASAVIAAE